MNSNNLKNQNYQIILDIKKKKKLIKNNQIFKDNLHIEIALGKILIYFQHKNLKKHKNKKISNIKINRNPIV